MTSAYRTHRDAIRQSALDPIQRHLLLELVEYWPHCWPSVETLAANTGYGERTVRKHLRELESAGAIQTTRREGLTSTYSLTGTYVPRHAVPPCTACPPAPGALTPARGAPPTPARGAPEADPDQADLSGWGRSHTFEVPDGEPPKAYLDDAGMAGVAPEVARDTWAYWRKTGLPVSGVRDLHGWLVMKAKKRGNGLRAPGPSTPAPARNAQGVRKWDTK